VALDVFDNAYFLINAVNLSDHVEQVKLERKVDMLEYTSMSHSEHRFMAGLQDWSLEVTLFQDYASGSVDATLNALIGSAAVAFETRPDAGAVAVANPKWTGSVVFEGYTPINGGVGTLQKVTAKFRPASALTRATA
jgi:hypothetical protein